MLAPLRRDLDIMPSPVPERPGLLIRDPMRYSENMLVVPWQLAPCLQCFDGKHGELDLRAELARIRPEVDIGSIADELRSALRDSAFLEDEHFEACRSQSHLRFAQAPLRVTAQAGLGYPADREELERTMRGYLEPDGTPAETGGIIAIAAPHVSPFGGWQSYRAAYRHLPRDAASKTFVILGTSHYGEPEKFGLTRKTFETPLGQTDSDGRIIERLIAKAGAAVTEEDYCHAVEHSIEFQVLFLQWLYGPGIRIVPILCGSFARSILHGGRPEHRPATARFLGELGEIAASEGDRLIWILGVDMAHIGRRYGDPFQARADQGRLLEVAARDRARNERIVEGDSEGFWDLVQQNRDDLRWCGSSPFYTFLKAVPQARGTVQRYEQWNIDDASVVTFAGISFRVKRVSAKTDACIAARS